MSDYIRPSVPDVVEPTHIDPYLIAHCELCDDDGYRGNRVCDHVDRTDIAKRGMTAVRAVLAKARKS